MDRKRFIKNTILGMAGAAGSIKIGRTAGKAEDRSLFNNHHGPVGFNHLPNKEERTMKTVLHRSATRGHANHGWLDSNHTFSFASYYNPERIRFGALRVLNDDVVAPGRGFGTHPHENMEIISIPLSGDLEHKDSMGHKAVIREGDIQVISAGTGIFHSEYNKNNDREVKFLQIWLLPREKNVTPRYDQLSLGEVAEKNTLYQVLSPNPDDQGVWIHQDAWFHLGDLDEGVKQTYHVKKKQNGVYVFVIDGEVDINGQRLYARDGFGIWDTDQFDIVSGKKSKILLMDVPMN